MIRFRPKNDDGPAKVSPRRASRQQVAERLDGSFEEGKRDLADLVHVEHGPWVLELDTRAVSTGTATVFYTRVRALARGRTELKLVIRPRQLLDRIAEAFGLRSLRGGDPTFLKRYRVRGKPKSFVRALLASSLTAEILGQRSIVLEVKKAERKERNAHGADTLAVSAQVMGILDEVDRMVGLFTLVRTALDELERIGVVSLDPV